MIVHPSGWMTLAVLALMPAVAVAQTPPREPGLVGSALRSLHMRGASLADDLGTAAPQAGALAASVSTTLQSADGVRSVAYLLVLFFIAAGVEWYYWTFAAGRLRAIEAAVPPDRRAMVLLALRGMALRLSGLLLFVCALTATSAAFVWPAGVQDLVLGLAAILAAMRFAWILAVTLLAPRASRLRLIRMPSRRAQQVTLLVTGGVAVFAVLIVGAELAARIGGAPRLGGALRLAAAALAAVVAVFVAHRIEADRRGRPAVSVRRRRGVPLPFGVALGCALVASLWLAGHERMALTLLMIAATTAAVKAAPGIVAFLWSAFVPPAPDAPAVAPGARILGRDLTLRAARFGLAVIGLATCAVLWEVPIIAMEGTETPAARLAGRLLGAAAIMLVADMAWAAVRGFVDSRLDAIAAAGGDPETGSQARHITLLPILRMTAGVVITVLLGLSLLSVMGIEITPLLAGAGIVGIAVGFGAQTLVRDILSGFFYLLEDVFRIGDYIEGGSAKGTVERITLRTVALRHQNGPLHFVPYGTLGSVRNNSRDWVIDKFELPLPISVDSEFIRKLVKKIGAEMAEDPAFAPVIMSPLKTKLYRIEPGVKVFRCKVQTPPGKQFEIRGEAYRRIEAALRAAGISFADSRSHIVLEGAPASPALPAPAAVAQPASA